MTLVKGGGLDLDVFLSLLQEFDVSKKNLLSP